MYTLCIKHNIYACHSTAIMLYNSITPMQMHSSADGFWATVVSYRLQVIIIERDHAMSSIGYGRRAKLYSNKYDYTAGNIICKSVTSALVHIRIFRLLIRIVPSRFQLKILFKDGNFFVYDQKSIPAVRVGKTKIRLYLCQHSAGDE